MSESFNDDYLSVRSSTLKLPPGLLDDDKLYEISVIIFNNKSEALASVSCYYLFERGSFIFDVQH